MFATESKLSINEFPWVIDLLQASCNNITPWQLLKLTPNELAVLNSWGVYSLITNGALPLSKALKLEPNQCLILNNPLVVNRIIAFKKFSISIDEAIALDDESAKKIFDKSLDEILEGGKQILQTPRNTAECKFSRT
jgi:hypothetical protein